MMGGEIGDALAPLAGGEIKIECGAGDVYTITLNCDDGLGHKITGTIVANPFSSPYAASVKAAPKHAAKPASVEIKSVNITKSRLEAREVEVAKGVKVR